MPHREPLEHEERPARGARRQDRRDRHPKDSTGSAARNRAVVSTPEERKSAPGPWKRLADVLVEPEADPALRAILEAGLTVDAEEGDGAAAILPSGEALLFLVASEGLLVRRRVTDDEVRLFLAGAREAA